MSALVNMLIARLVKEGQIAEAQNLAVLEESETSNRRLLGDVEVQLRITSQDRDNRRRRMELATLILDEQQLIDVERLWGVATGNQIAIDRKSYEYYQRIDSENTQRMFGEVNQPRIFGAPSPYRAETQGDVSTLVRDTDIRRPPLDLSDVQERSNAQPDPTATPTKLHPARYCKQPGCFKDARSGDTDYCEDHKEVPVSLRHCPKNPAWPHAHQWANGMIEPTCIHKCGAQLLQSQSVMPDPTATPTQPQANCKAVGCFNGSLEGSDYCFKHL